MAASTKLLAISLAEWRAWLSELRLEVLPARIVRIEGDGDQQGFARLIERSRSGSPDDASLVLARLHPDCRLPAPSRTDLVTIEIGEVLEFLPLSADGRLMLESDARQMKVRLGIPEYEQLWKEWRERHRDALNDSYGRALAELLGLPSAALVLLSSDERDWLAHNPSRNQLERRGDYEASQALCWFDALVRFGDQVGEESKKEANKKHGLSDFLNRRKAIHDLLAPCIDHSDLIELGKKLREELRSETAKDVSFLQLVVLSHYRYLLLTGRELKPESLRRDLSVLAREEGPAVAAAAAYFIGRHMPTGMIASLRYATTPDRYPFLDDSTRVPLRPVETLAQSDPPAGIDDHAEDPDAIAMKPGVTPAADSAPIPAATPTPEAPTETPSSSKPRRSRQR
jgi:hypothetical protein